jgi:hypothetical protein
MFHVEHFVLGWKLGEMGAVGRCQDATRIGMHTEVLPNLDHAAAVGCLQFPGALDHFVGEGEERFRVGRLVAFHHDGMAAVAAFADVGIEFDGAEERHAELLRGALASAFGEDVDLLWQCGQTK